MARKIVWSDYLGEESVFRYWYVLENNNFKSAIKRAQKEGKMNYANMHNALYSGLYYPEKDYNYPFRTVTTIRKEKGLSKGSTLANFMERHEILQNIHAMYDSANIIRKKAPYGYNAKLFAKEFELIGKQEVKLAESAKIKTKKLFNSTPSEDEQEPNKPHRYNLAKRLVREHLDRSFRPRFYIDTSKQRQSKFEKALHKYNKSKINFNNALAKQNITSFSKIKLMHESLDAGLYRTVLPHHGFDFENVIKSKHKNLNKLITTKELELHSKKFDLGARSVKASKSTSTNQLAQELEEAGLKAREHYIKRQRTYPECNIGFLNTFCEMISRRIIMDSKMQELAQDTDALTVAENIISTIERLMQQHAESKSNYDKKQIEKQIENFKKSLESSNEHNI